MKGIAIPVSVLLIIFTFLLSGSFSGVITEETYVQPLQLSEGESNVYTTEIFHVPLFIKDVRVDVSVKANSYLWVWVEMKIGNQILEFRLNDLSLGYHIEQDKFQLEGRISEQAVSCKATIDTDGIIGGIPKLVLTFYTLK